MLWYVTALLTDFDIHIAGGLGRLFFCILAYDFGSRRLFGAFRLRYLMFDHFKFIFH